MTDCLSVDSAADRHIEYCWRSLYHRTRVFTVIVAFELLLPSHLLLIYVNRIIVCLHLIFLAIKWDLIIITVVFILLVIFLSGDRIMEARAGPISSLNARVRNLRLHDEPKMVSRTLMFLSVHFFCLYVQLLLKSPAGFKKRLTCIFPCCSRTIAGAGSGGGGIGVCGSGRTRS